MADQIEVPVLELKSADAAVNTMTDSQLMESLGIAESTPGEPVAEPVAEAPVAEVATPAAEAPPTAPPAEAPVAAQPPKDAAAAPETPAPKASEHFTAYDSKGELEIPADVKIKFVANGKELDLPVENVVRMAQMGQYNAERQAEVETTRADNLRLTQQVTQVQTEAQQALQQYEAWFKKALTEEGFIESARESYAQANSPEARLQRMEAERAQEISARQAADEAQRISSFVQTELTPRVTRLLEENPSVSFDEAMGRFTVLTAPYLVRGQITPQALPTVQRLIESDLAAFVRAKHAERQKATTTVTTQVEAERTKTALAKRQLARATQPAPTTPAPAASTGFKSSEEWLEKILTGV